MKRAERRIRRLERRIEDAVEDHGPETVVDALEGALDGLEAGARGTDERPRSADYDSLEAFRAARAAYLERKRTETGPAIERGRTPGVVTRDPDDAG